MALDEVYHVTYGKATLGALIQPLWNLQPSLAGALEMLRLYGNNNSHDSAGHGRAKSDKKQGSLAEFPDSAFGHDLLLIITRLVERAYRVLLEVYILHCQSPS